MKNRYSHEEINFLKENYLKMSNRQLSDNLGRSIDSIASKLLELNLIRRKMNPYSEKEKEFIVNNLNKLTISEIAKSLGRTQSGVSKHIAKHLTHRIRIEKKIYIDNIDKDIPPFYSKADNYSQIICQMLPNDSFEFPKIDLPTVNNEKYKFINSKEGAHALFITRTIGEKDGIIFSRIWRLK